MKSLMEKIEERLTEHDIVNERLMRELHLDIRDHINNKMTPSIAKLHLDLSKALSEEE